MLLQRSRQRRQSAANAQLNDQQSAGIRRLVWTSDVRLQRGMTPRGRPARLTPANEVNLPLFGWAGNNSNQQQLAQARGARRNLPRSEAVWPVL